MNKPLTPDGDPGRVEENAQAHSSPYAFRFLTWKAETLPGVDICDRKSLYDIMEDR